MVAMATSLRCRVSAISAFCRPPLKLPSTTNCIVAIVHTKPVIAILVPKLVAMAKTLKDDMQRFFTKLMQKSFLAAYCNINPSV